jgi:hypothetical protein
MALLAITKLDWKDFLAVDKHSSLFWSLNSDEEKKGF